MSKCDSKFEYRGEILECHQEKGHGGTHSDTIYWTTTQSQTPESNIGKGVKT